jgi:hypothetical protein
MAEDQRNARIFGVLFLITFVTSIGALALFQSAAYSSERSVESRLRS